MLSRGRYGQMSRSFLLIIGVIVAMWLPHRHKDCVSEHEYDESHSRYHDEVVTVINGSEGPLQE
jgi:hypothetical protein